MGTKWTENQIQAIMRRGGTVLVSAAAGSGKTSVLVQRIIDIITDEQNPVDADKLLVVTFTNAAASQMSAKIKKELERLAAENPGDNRLRAQAFLLGRAQISTVHSFCVSLLRENFNELDIPPDFVLADSIVATDMRRRALEQTMDELYADKNSGIESLCDLFGRARSDRDTANLIERLYDFETNLAFPKNWEQHVLSDTESGTPLANTKIGEYIFTYAKNLAESALGMVSEALEVCSDNEALQSAYAPALNDDFVFINALLSRIKMKYWDETLSHLRMYTPSRLGSAKEDENGAKTVANELRNKVKAILQKKLPNNCFICTEQEYADDTRKLAGSLRSLFGAVSVFEKNLTEIKLTRQVFEFCDLERYAINLLCGENGEKTDIAHQTSERFEHVLVDEYQDTNEIQDLIFKLVSRDEKNLFFVGDIKQSIYGFRRANPEIFSRRRDTFYNNNTGLFPAKIALAHNFRSEQPVIDAINAVFLPIMTRRVGGTDYFAEGEQLIAESDDSPENNAAGLELHLVDREKAISEPEHVASVIAEMLKNKYQVEQDGKQRNCKESDFCVLLRSAKGRAKEYIRALKQQGIRCWTDDDNNFFASSEIAVLIALLRVVDNPRRNIELAAVMMSPLFGFSPDDMANLRLTERSAPLYSLLLSSRDEKIQRFLSLIKEIRAKRNSMPVGEFIQYAVDFLNAEIALCAGEQYSARRNNIRMLIEYADSFSASSDGSLASFLRICETAARGKGGFSRSFSPPNDAVCVTTVHKSKGLEWPVVIVANAEKQFNLSDSKEPTMLFDSALGIGSRVRTKTPSGSAFYSHKTLNYTALALASNERNVSEEMRVLYVALTRARQKIIVTAAVKDIENTLENWRVKAQRAIGYSVATAQSWLDWIGLSLASYNSKFTAAERENLTVCGPISLSVYTDIAPKTESTPQQPAAADPALVHEINKRAEFVYKREALTSVPGKLSVTDLSGKNGTSTLYRPSFASSSVSAVRRGSAMHLFMQYADYKNAALSIENELRRLVAGEYLDRESAKGIDTAKLRDFFHSELGEKAAGENVLREYEFIDSIDASEIKADLPPDLAETKVMLQGIADCIILEEDGAILLDYKSDRVSSPAQLIERYTTQLALYRQALDKQLPVSIKSSVIYSFELGEAVEIPDRVAAAII